MPELSANNPPVLKVLSQKLSTRNRFSQRAEDSNFSKASEQSSRVTVGRMWWVLVVVGITRASATGCRVVSTPSLGVECLELEQTSSRQLLGSGAETPHREVMWVHAPKTGSSFCLTVAHEQCRHKWQKQIETTDPHELDLHLNKGCAKIGDFKCDVHVTWHAPLWDAALLTQYLVVAVVRQPLARIVSSFFDHKHHEGYPAWEILRGEMKANADSKCLGHTAHADEKVVCREVAEFEVYARDPYMAACQTKMIGGYNCSSPIEGSIDALFEESKRRLQLFFFVGLFDDWDNMIVSFQSRLGYDDTSFSAVDFAHLRSAAKPPSIPLDILRNYADPVDEKLHAYAKVLYCCRHRVEPAANSSSSAFNCDDVDCRF